MTAILQLPITQLLDLWSDLESARCGKNGFGSYTAELYAYRFRRHDPYLLITDEATREEIENRIALESAQILHDLLVYFADRRECRLFIDGKKLGKWVAKTPFVHRVHVEVVP